MINLQITMINYNKNGSISPVYRVAEYRLIINAVYLYLQCIPL